jgi:hypothetical protein
MGRKYKFPCPSDVSSGQGAVLCPAERVIALYNQGSNNVQRSVKISKKVREWFFDEAHSKGWAGVRFIKDVQSSHGSGCILWIPPRQIDVSINVTQETLVLVNSSEV